MRESFPKNAASVRNQGRGRSGAQREGFFLAEMTELFLFPPDVPAGSWKAQRSFLGRSGAESGAVELHSCFHFRARGLQGQPELLWLIQGLTECVARGSGALRGDFGARSTNRPKLEPHRHLGTAPSLATGQSPCISASNTQQC